MKKVFPVSLFLTAMFVLSGVFSVSAQTDSRFSPNPNQTDAPPTRPNLLQGLDLSKSQLLEIRRLNQEKKPLMQEAQRNLRSAQQQLDEAIYADNVDENLIQTRLLAAQKAHEEVLKIRANSEIAVRKVLTAEQLIKFRQIRQQFEQTRQNLQTRRQEVQNNPNAPLNSLQNRRLKRQRLKVVNNLSNAQ